MATDAVYNFMKEHNRPFSANDIQNSLNDHGKTAVQKALDKLAEEGSILQKCYGKQKVYCVSQDADEGNSNMQEELKSMDRKINEVSLKLAEDEENLNKNIVELRECGTSLAEAKNIALELEQEIEIVKTKIEESKENIVVISEQDKKKITTKYKKYCNEYKKRKRLCMDMIGTILEGYPKSKKHLLEETEIETDEDVNYKFEELMC